MTSRMRLVLDTNIWIDWLVFDDPAIAPVKAACRAGHIQILANAACLEELNKVLAYPEFGLDHAQRKSHLEEVGRCAVKHGYQQAAHSTALPRCSDPDDQKFLELARDARADWLLTKDKALLRLGNKRLLAAGFRVGTPQQWMDSASV